jgi:MFS family permease
VEAYHTIATTVGVKRSEAKFVFRALGSRNYRLFFMGQCVSLIGTWTQQAALSWLVYRITGSTLLLGAVAFSNQIPTLFLGPFTGVAADRFDRKHLLLLTQGLSMVQALVLALLVWTETIAPWHIIVLSVFIGAVNALDNPVRQAFVVEMVEKREDLANAIPLNSALTNGARFIGPSLAGIIIYLRGEGFCFLVNAFSYLAVLAALLAIDAAGKQKIGGKCPVWVAFREELEYVYNFKPILAVLGLISLFSIAGAPYAVLMPAYVKDVLRGGAHTFGFLMSAEAIGALSATIYLASRSSADGLIKLIPAAAGTCGLCIAAFALSGSFTLCLFFLFIAGFSMTCHLASSNTIIQTVVDEDKRGRVMSLYTMSFLAVMPFGSLLAGSVAGKTGVQSTMLLGAVTCIAGASIFAMKLTRLCELLRPVFADIGSYQEERSKSKW